MAFSRRSSPTAPGQGERPPTTQSHGTPGGTHNRVNGTAEWLSLTDLGRVYGISAIHTGKLLAAAGLLLPSGEPTARAVDAGLGRAQHGAHPRQALWHRQGCGQHLERQGQVPRKRHNLIGLWADLLTALQQGSEAVSMSAEEMAAEIPHELVAPVNRELRQRGCSFQVRPSLRRAASPQPACSPSPASGAADPHPCG
jgi:hypothetical protein